MHLVDAIALLGRGYGNNGLCYNIEYFDEVARIKGTNVSRPAQLSAV